MKYKVVKDKEGSYPCDGCVMDSYISGCINFIEDNHLPNCAENHCHFELDDEITDVDIVDNTPTDG